MTIILDTTFKKIKELMSLETRFLYWNKINNGYTILLDNQNVILRTQVKFKDIKEYYENIGKQGTENELLTLFEQTHFLRRENTIKIKDEDSIVENKFTLKKAILHTTKTFNSSLIKIINGKIIETENETEIGEVITETLFWLKYYGN